jgi:hypothetical protein
MTGPQFLGFYAGLATACAVVALAVRHALRQPADEPSSLPADPYQAGYLAGGWRALTEAAVVALTGRGLLQPQPNGRVVALPGDTGWLHPVERAVYDTVAQAEPTPSSSFSSGAARLAGRMADRAERPGLRGREAEAARRLEAKLREAGQPVPGVPPASLVGAGFQEVGEVIRQLRDRGLVMTGEQARKVRWVPALIVLAAAVAGGFRLVTGLAAGHAVGYLVGLLLATLVAAGLFLRTPGPRSRRGDYAVRALRRSNAALRSNAVAAGGVVAGGDLALAVALFGPAVLAGGPLADLQGMLRAGGVASGGGGDGGGGGSSCGGGCGGGGGGCGG